MKILRRELIVLLVTLALLAVASASPSQAEKLALKLESVSHHAGPKSRKLRVLFIGNSYTYVNNLPALSEVSQNQRTSPSKAK